MKAITSTICILLLLNSLNFAQDSIGFSFNSDRDDTPMDENTIAGVVPSSGWLSTDGAGAGANGTLENNGVTIDWSSNGTWNTNNGVTNGDNHLMNSYIDAVGDGGYSDIDVSGIDTFTFGAAYDLYVYFGSDGNGRTGKVALQDGETYSYSTFSQQGGGFPGSYIRTEDVGDGNPNANYAVFEGLSGDTQKVQIIRGSNNSGFHGIQIVLLQDTDEDGLPDEWEENNDLDPEDNGEFDPNNGPEGDPDQDGLNNLEEYDAKTSPQDADTDKDGLNDNVETNTGEFVDATDSGSNPNKADTDGDSLNDRFEVESNPFVTDPNNADTDGDRLSDAEEIGNQDNPTDPTKVDTDGGGTSDSVEIALGLDPSNPADDDDGAGGGTKIGINFNSNRGTDAEISPDEIAGLPEVAQLNWNNSAGGADAQAGANGSQADIISPIEGVIVDDTGGDSGVTVDWASNGTWNTNNSFESPDAKLMNGYIDYVGGGGFATVDFQGIPYSSYDVYVYFGSDGNGRTGDVESTTADQKFSYTTDSQKGGFDPETDYLLTEDETDSYPSANYCVFKEQTGPDFSVLINRGSNNSGFHGIQIVSLGPGTPFEMTDIIYNSETDEFTLTWNSKPNQIYALYVSEDLKEWEFDLDDSINSDGDTTTYGPFENPMPRSKQLFFQAKETDEE